MLGSACVCRGRLARVSAPVTAFPVSGIVGPDILASGRRGRFYENALLASADGRRSEIACAHAARAR